MNDYVDHHYLPKFYLKLWAGDDKQVCRFSRPYGDKIVSERVSPKGTAYEEHLYSIHPPGGPPVPDMERDFMSKLDSEASDALKLLKSNLVDSAWEPRLRSAWSRFVWAQNIRTPSEIAQTKSLVKETWDGELPDLQRKFQKFNVEGAPEDIKDYLAIHDPCNEERLALSIARQFMDHSGIGTIISNMHWKVLDFDGCGIPLLTSDRPVWMTTTLIESDAFLLMPIGPESLFVAARGRDTLHRIASQRRRQQAKNVNKLIVQHAEKFVFGVNDLMGGFVRKHFATRRHSTHMERLAASRSQRIVSKDSPLSENESR